MSSSTTVWRITPAGWSVVGLAVAAETISNGLRAYALGQHLDRFTMSVGDYQVSIAGAVLVLAAAAVSLSQARAAWVALTPRAPARQRIVSGLAAVLLLAVSATAMGTHILEAQRTKTGDESGTRAAYKRASAAYAKTQAEFDGLGNPRPVSVIQTAVQSAKIDMAVWRRSKECADISRDDTKTACAPILDLYQERGNAARKAQLGPQLVALKTELDRLRPPPEAAAPVEATVATLWAWIMAAAVVFLATFGAVLFAKVDVVTEAAVHAEVAAALPPPGGRDVNDIEADEPPPGGQKSKRECLADLLTLTALGRDIPWPMALSGSSGAGGSCPARPPPVKEAVSPHVLRLVTA